MIKQILFVFLSLTLSTTSILAEKPKPIVKIGVIVPLSGDMALHGTEIQHALELAKENSGSEHYKYELIFEDNQLDGKQSVSSASRLVNIEKVDVVVTLWPPTANVVIPITEKNNVLHYTISWDPALAKNNKLVLSHQAMVDSIVKQTLQQLESKGLKRVAFLHMEETGFNLGATYFQQIAPTFDLKLVVDEAFSPDDRDFRSLLSRVDSKKPDSYLIWSVMPTMDILIKQIRERNKDAVITGYLDYAEDLSKLDNAEYISEMYSDDSFASLYLKKFQEKPVSKGPNAFDIFNLVTWAYEQFPEEKPDATRVKNKLLTIKNYKGAVGTFSINQFGNSTYPPVWRKVDAGNRSLIKVPDVG